MRCNKSKAAERGILLDDKIILTGSEKLLFDEEPMSGIDINTALTPTMREDTAETTGTHPGH